MEVLASDHIEHENVVDKEQDTHVGFRHGNSERSKRRVHQSVENFDFNRVDPWSGGNDRVPRMFTVRINQITVLKVNDGNFFNWTAGSFRNAKLKHEPSVAATT